MLSDRTAWLRRPRLIEKPRVGHVGCDRREPAADLLQTVLRRARRGDLQATALIFSRVWPIRKVRVRFDLPSLDRAVDLPHALAAVVAAVSKGLLSPDEAAAVATVLNAQSAAIELVEIEQRLRGLTTMNCGHTLRTVWSDMRRGTMSWP